jgi:hypothetical protein
MPSTESGEPADTGDAAVPEKRPPQRDGLLVLIIRTTALLTVAWVCLLVLLGWWLIRAVL